MHNEFLTFLYDFLHVFEHNPSFLAFAAFQVFLRFEVLPNVTT